MNASETPVRSWATVPASTSNLGPGFDALGMAVDRRLSARLTLRPGSIELIRRGTPAGVGGDPEDDLCVRTVLEAIPGAQRGLRLELDSEIPVGKGLGSSAAARVAGELLAARATGREPDALRILARVAASEGHPDNAAPAILGGLVAVGVRDGVPDARPLPVSEAIGWGWVAPDASLPTEEARRALPDRWPRGEVVAALSRLARLIPALADPGPEGAGLRDLLEDTLHVPYRLPRIPGGVAARSAAMEAGAWAVTISGAGSGLIVLAAPGDVDRVLEGAARAFDAAGAGPATRFRVRPAEGARSGAGSPPEDQLG